MIPTNPGFKADSNTQGQRSLVEHVRSMVKASHTYMQRFYNQWDTNHNLYKSRRALTKEETDAMAKGRLGRVKLPLTYTQVESLVTFSYALFTQRQRLFELEGTSDEDKDLRECAELLLHGNFRAMNGYTMLPALLRDFAIKGIAVVKDWWDTPTEAVPEVVTTPAVVELGVELTKAEDKVVFKQQVVAQQNQVQQISPFSFFPDPSVPLYDWVKGRYVVTESEISPEGLKASTFYKNTEQVPATRNKEVSSFRDRSRTTETDVTQNANQRDKRVASNVVLSEWVGWLNPSEFESPFEAGKKLGEEEFEVRYIVVMANDQVVVRAEPYTNASRHWPVSAAVYAPCFVDDDDMDAVPRPTASLNNAADWLISARGVAVSKTIGPRLIIDPVGIDPATVRDETGNIVLNRSASNQGVDRFVKALPFQDTTVGHFTDATILADFSNTTLGVSDAALGQIATGRRSATEMSSVMSASASRTKMAASMFWENLLAPMGQRWLARFRQGLSEEFFALYCGEAKKSYYPTFHQDSLTIARAQDFWVFDGVLPSEKAYTAKALQEIFSLLISSPTASMTFNLSPEKVLRAIAELRGLGRLTNFSLSQEEVQAALGQLQQIQQIAAPPSNQPPVTQ